MEGSGTLVNGAWFATGVACGVMLRWVAGRWRKSPGLSVPPPRKARGNFKMVFVVRTDLGMGKGKIAAQCAHAAVDCYRLALRDREGVLRAWEGQGMPKVTLKCTGEGEEEIHELKVLARSLGLTACTIRDAGRTQVESGSLTVLGIGPGEISAIDQVTGHLKLL
ncbi:peptidyl-tRNA hydrolase 2, mitochondrial-like [Bacillus rossius redtenbacheri]|uniref:peptidyl-tRNA hydrolase 2, mitochondrial-like n=1 Tax=Bacillus rossius redtenbacheri TaxID=93214 RepID=UPI002FDE8D25